MTEKEMHKATCSGLSRFEVPFKPGPLDQFVAANAGKEATGRLRNRY
jgi:hypothetical protein